MSGLEAARERLSQPSELLIFRSRGDSPAASHVTLRPIHPSMSDEGNEYTAAAIWQAVERIGKEG